MAKQHAIVLLNPLDPQWSLRSSVQSVPSEHIYLNGPLGDNGPVH